MHNFKIRNKLFGTYPIIFHHPGYVGGPNNIVGILKIKKLFFNFVKGPSGQTFLDRKEMIKYEIPASRELPTPDICKELTVIFITNLKEMGSAPRSLDYFGMPYRVFGSEVKNWKNSEKIALLIKELPLITTKYFLLMDTDDTFAVDKLDRILEEIKSKPECKMLLNAAQNFWPAEQLEKYDVLSFCDKIGKEKKSAHKYINSGVFITETAFYRKIVPDMDVTKAPLIGSDQSLFYLLYKKYYPKVQLDYHCKVFQCEFDQELVIEAKSIPSWKRIYIHTESKIYPYYLIYLKNRQKLLRYLYRFSH